MRVSDSMINSFIQRSNLSAQSVLLDLTQKITSDHQISKPSEDLVKARQIVGLNRMQTHMSAVGASLMAVGSDLNLADQTMNSVVDVLGSVKALALQMVGQGLSAADRSAGATAARGYFQQLLALANHQTADGRYLFGGVKDTTPAYAADGSYQGSDASRQVEVSPGVRVDGTVNGPQSLGGSGQELFKPVGDLITALENNDTAGIRASIGTVQGALTSAIVHSTAIGARVQGLTEINNVNDALNSQIMIQKNNVQDINLMTELSNFSAAQIALQAVVSSTRQLAGTGLVNFLGK